MKNYSFLMDRKNNTFTNTLIFIPFSHEFIYYIYKI